jgi:hypothetical protein
MAAFFVLVGLWPLLAGDPARIQAMATAAIFAVTALAAPRYLTGLNRLWTRLGALMHVVVSPFALGTVFFLTVLPIGLIMRALGKRPLAHGFDSAKPSYWVPRDPPGPDRQSFINQF